MDTLFPKVPLSPYSPAIAGFYWGKSRRSVLEESPVVGYGLEWESRRPRDHGICDCYPALKSLYSERTQGTLWAGRASPNPVFPPENRAAQMKCHLSGSLHAWLLPCEPVSIPRPPHQPKAIPFWQTHQSRHYKNAIYISADQLLYHWAPYSAIILIAFFACHLQWCIQGLVHNQYCDCHLFWVCDDSPSLAADQILHPAALPRNRLVSSATSYVGKESCILKKVMSSFLRMNFRWVLTLWHKMPQG